MNEHVPQDQNPPLTPWVSHSIFPLTPLFPRRWNSSEKTGYRNDQCYPSPNPKSKTAMVYFKRERNRVECIDENCSEKRKQKKKKNDFELILTGIFARKWWKIMVRTGNLNSPERGGKWWRTEVVSKLCFLFYPTVEPQTSRSTRLLLNYSIMSSDHLYFVDQNLWLVLSKKQTVVSHLLMALISFLVRFYNLKYFFIIFGL